jgi:hypothetical protein
VYLGIGQIHDIQRKNEKYVEVEEGVLEEIEFICGQKLNAKNKTQTVGSLAVLAATNTFGIINWHKEVLRKLDRKAGKLLIIHRRHYPRSDIYRLYFPMKQRKRANTVRRRLHTRSYENDGICGQQGS